VSAWRIQGRSDGLGIVDGINCSGAMIEAGSETTSAMLNNAIIGLLSNPSTIAAAHEELDRVVGSNRTPNFNDEPNLPYMRAIIKVSPSFLLRF
jgi:Cytochrome P450